MNVRTLILLAVALAAAIFTAFFARNWLEAQRTAILASVPKAAAAPSSLVLVAGKNLPAGSFIKAEHMKWQPWPESGVIENYAVRGKRNEKDFVGAVVRTRLNPGEPLTDARVVHPGDRGFLAAVLEPGKRAVSVPVNATSGIAGFVFPGDKVDVILTVRFRAEDDEGKGQTRYFSETLLNDIRVLAIDQAVENAKGEAAVAKTATLEVEPKQAEKIAIALEMGSLSLSLHSLAREDERVAEMMEGTVTASPNAGRSYTLDQDVYYMQDALIRGGKAGGRPKQTVNVLRGGKAEAAVF